jgi:hypothetical protein
MHCACNRFPCTLPASMVVRMRLLGLLGATLLFVLLVSSRFGGTSPTPRGAPHVISRTDKLLVMYSGPNSMVAQEDYHQNMVFFLEHGLPCSYHTNATLQLYVDVVLVLSESVAAHYRFDRYNAGCGGVRVVTRTDNCYDMGSYNVVLNERKLTSYDYFIGVNCGLIGPLLPLSLGLIQADPYWAMRFITPINNRTKFVGLTLNCQDWNDPRLIHAQSMLWATDGVGLAAIQEKKAIFDCTRAPACNRSGLSQECRGYIINRYEVGMSQAVLGRGYSITSTMPYQYGLTLSLASSTPYPSYCVDTWRDATMRWVNGGSLATPLEVIFWKRSRFYPASISRHVNQQTSMRVLEWRMP